MVWTGVLRGLHLPVHLLTALASLRITVYRSLSVCQGTDVTSTVGGRCAKADSYHLRILSTCASRVMADMCWRWPVLETIACVAHMYRLCIPCFAR